MMLRIENGAFVRQYPERGGDGDDGGGWRCYDRSSPLSGDFGDVNAGVDPSRPN